MGRDTRSCPICRTTNYQKKITTVGSKSFHKICALRIQALWRGYTSKKKYRLMLKNYYRNQGNTIASGSSNTGIGSYIARRIFFEKEFSALSHTLEVESNARIKGLNNVVNGIDKTLNEGKELDALFDQVLRQREAAREEMGLSNLTVDEDDDSNNINNDTALQAAISGINNANTNLSESLDVGDGSSTDDFVDNGSTKQRAVVLTEEQWTNVALQAKCRGLGECAICMSANRSIRNVCMLSCSHVFHSQCIANFERFFEEHSSNKNKDVSPVCPVCRSHFMTRPITTAFELIALD